MYYVVGIGVAALFLFLLPYPWGSVILFGLVLGGIFRLGDRIGPVEAKLGMKDQPEYGSATDPYAAAERRRIEEMLSKPAKTAPPDPYAEAERRRIEEMLRRENRK